MQLVKLKMHHVYAIMHEIVGIYKLLVIVCWGDSESHHQLVMVQNKHYSLHMASLKYLNNGTKLSLIHVIYEQPFMFV